MKNIKYLFSNVKIYLQLMTTIILTVLFLSIFVDNITLENSKFNVLNNSSCHFVAYDDWVEDNNCYKYYENNVDVYFEDESNLLNVYILEFISGVEYDNFSLINEKNTVLGKYIELKPNEVALPISFKEEYNVSLNDNIFISKKECIIKFFYNDIYQIHKFDHTYNINTILVGNDTIDNSESLFCKLNPTDDTYHFKLYNLQSTRNNIKDNISLIHLICCGICFLINFIFLGMLKFKNETMMFKKSIISGERNIFIKSIVVEFIYLITLLFILLISLSWNKLAIFMITTFIASILNFVVWNIINCIYLVERRGK